MNEKETGQESRWLKSDETREPKFGIQQTKDKTPTAEFQVHRGKQRILIQGHTIISGLCESVATQYLFHNRSSNFVSRLDLKCEISNE
jgi:hypothetical protein